MRLYHYTCDHGREGIGTIGRVEPGVCYWAPGLPSVVWLTDLSQPDREGLGLTSTFLSCDRLAHRYVITDSHLASPWQEVADRLLGDTENRRTAEAFGATEHWFVADRPVRAVLDLTYYTARQIQGAGQ